MRCGVRTEHALEPVSFRTWLSLRLAATKEPRPASLNGSRLSAKLIAVSAFESGNPLSLACVGGSAPSSSHAVSIR